MASGTVNSTEQADMMPAAEYILGEDVTALAASKQTANSAGAAEVRQYRPMVKAEMDAALAEAKAKEPPPEPSPFPPSVTQAEFHARVEEAKRQAEPVSVAAPVKKVAVLGFTDSWKKAPFDDPSWEIWGLNELYMFIPRWTRWFELHQRSVYEADKKRTSDHIYALRAMTCPLYMHQHYEDMPTSIPYPLQAIAAAFPNPAGGLPYLTNSISFMLALSILEGFQEIMVCGVDMSADSEYQQQRPSCEYFLGIAQGRGIKVTLPGECELLHTNFLYGYQQEELERWNQRMLAREKDLQNKIEGLNQQRSQLEAGWNQYQGALQDTQHLRKNWKQIIATS